MKTPRFLFVCLGNICRSPVAEGIFRNKANELGINMEFDSAGTGGWHVGEAPDHRMTATAKKYGVDISSLRARQFTTADFDRFDRIYVMDESNLENVVKQARNEQDRQKVSLILNELYPGQNMPVPDPYFGGQSGFDHVFELLQRSADKILKP